MLACELHTTHFGGANHLLEHDERTDNLFLFAIMKHHTKQPMEAKREQKEKDTGAVWLSPVALTPVGKLLVHYLYPDFNHIRIRYLQNLLPTLSIYLQTRGFTP